MRYQQPSLQDLISFTDTLNTYVGENSQRLAFRDLYKELMRGQQDTDIILGLLIYEREFIKSKYSHISPKKQKGWFCDSGSEIYSLIDNVLGLDQKILRDNQAIIYLFKFYQYISSFSNDAVSLYPYFFFSPDNVKSILKKLFLREKSRIELFANSTPALNMLDRGIKELREQYDAETASRWFTNHKRTALLECIEVINASCARLYPTDTGNDIVDDENYMKSSQVRLGMVIYALLKINKDDGYQDSFFFSPINSALFRLCLNVINQESLNTIDFDSRLNWLAALDEHIQLLKKSKHYETFKIDIEKLERFHADIMKHRMDQEALKIMPSRFKRYGAQVLTSATQSLVVVGTAKLTAEFAIPVIGSVIGAAASAIAIPIGYVLYGSTGVVIMTQLGRLVDKRIIPTAAAWMHSYMLEQVGAVVAGTAVGMVLHRFNATNEDFRTSLRDLPADERQFMQEWIHTLLNLPSDILDDDLKSQIRIVAGIEALPPRYEASSQSSRKAARV